MDFFNSMLACEPPLLPTPFQSPHYCSVHANQVPKDPEEKKIRTFQAESVLVSSLAPSSKPDWEALLWSLHLSNHCGTQGGKKGCSAHAQLVELTSMEHLGEGKRDGEAGKQWGQTCHSRGGEPTGLASLFGEGEGGTQMPACAHTEQENCPMSEAMG